MSNRRNNYFLLVIELENLWCDFFFEMQWYRNRLGGGGGLFGVQCSEKGLAL